MVSFPLPLLEARGYSSLIFTVSTSLELLEVKRTKAPPALPLLGSCEVFNSQTWPYCASINVSVTVQIFLLWQRSPGWFLLTDFCSGKLWFSATAFLPQSFGRQWFALCPYFSGGSRKSCWFFKLFNFLLVKME